MQHNSKQMQQLTGRIIIGVMTVFYSFTSTAQRLDLATCLKMADTANSSIRNARLDVVMNQQQKSAYESALFPKITASGDYRYNAVIPGQVVPAAFFGGQPGTYATVQFGVPFILNNTVQLSQVLYNPQVNYGLKVLDINQKVVEIKERMTVQEVKQQVATVYFNLQAITKQLSFIESNILSFDKLIANMSAMNREGMVVSTEVDKLKINRLNLVNSKQTLASQFDQSSSLLKILIGLDKDATISFVADELIEKTVLVDESTISRPELELLQTQVTMNEEERKGTKMAYLPSLALYAAYNYSYNIKPEDNFRKGIESSFIGLKLDWTLFDGFEKKNKLKANAINSEKLKIQQENLEKQLELATSIAKQQIEIQSNSLLIAKEQLMLAERVYKQTEAQFNQGLISSNDLILAENSQREAQTKLVVAYVQLRNAEINYLKSIGNIN